MQLIKIAYIGPINCVTKTTQIKNSLYKLTKLNAIIISGGNLEGFENTVKQTAIQFKLDYREFTPAFMERNQYSVQPEDYFGKKYHYTYLLERYMRILRYVDVIVIGYDDDSAIDKMYYQIIKKAEKLNKKIIII